MSSRPPAALSRRTTIGVAGATLGAALLSACDLGGVSGGSLDVPGRSDPQPDPDRVLVERVVADVQTRLAAVVDARQRFQVLRGPLSDLEQMHRAHLAALAADLAASSAPSTPTPTTAAPRRPVAARRADARVRAAETTHQDGLVSAAVDARSGALARLLASAAASVGQHLDVLGAPPTTPPDPTLADASTVQAWQRTLAGEEAALYVWAVLGARTSQSGAPTLFAAVRAAYVEHRERRDDLIGQVAATGATPTPAATAYALPGGLDTASGVRAAAVALEEGGAATYAALVGATSAAAREQAIAWLEISAIRVLAFRGTPEMFPGAGEYADH